MIIQSVLLQLLPIFAGIVSGGTTLLFSRHIRRQKAMVAALEREAEASEVLAYLKDEDREYFETWDRILNIYTEPVKPTPTEAERHADEDQAEYERKWKAEVAAREAGEFYDWGSSEPVGGTKKPKAADPGVAREVKRREGWLAEQNRKALSSITPHADVGERFPIYINTDLEDDWGVLGHADLRPHHARGIADQTRGITHEIEETRNKLAARKRELKSAKAKARSEIQNHTDAISAMKSIVDDIIAVHRAGQAVIIPEAMLEIGDFPLLTSDDIDEEIARLDQLRRKSEKMQNRSSVLVNLLDPATGQPIAVPMSDAVCENGVWRMNGYEHTPRSTDS